MSTSRDDIQSIVRHRRLAAIMMADISGYSRLMGADEEGTLTRMRRHRREIIDPAISEHHGRLVNAPGDSLLAVFDSPLEAVRCALVIQQSIFARNVSLPRSAWLQYRIGVNLGDIIVDPTDGTVYGDGVNVAARLEAMAEPGGVLISGGVYEQIKNKLVCGYQSLGDEKLKNITDPVHVYKVLPDPASVSRATRAKAGRWVALAGVAGAAVLGLGLYGAVQPASLWSHISFIRQQVGMDTSAPNVPVPIAKPSSDAQTPARSPRLANASPPEPRPSRPPEPPPDVSATFTTSPAETAPVAPDGRTQQGTKLAPGLETAFTRETLPGSNTQSQTPNESAPQQAIAAVVPPAGIGRTRTSDDGKSFKDCEQCPEMVRLTGGSFRMGSNEDSSEQPIHQVNVRSFALSRYPITNREWRFCAEAKACRFVPEGTDDSPVRNISWADTQEYITWLTRVTGQPYRLPSEAEWEYAARAGTISRYWWGDRMAPKMANCRGCGDPYDSRQPLTVNSTAPNPFGLYGMGGGVAQWVADCWHPTYQGAPNDGSARTESGCVDRVLRGGSWRSSSSEIRPGSRAHYEAGVRHPNHGFRVARGN